MNKSRDRIDARNADQFGMDVSQDAELPGMSATPDAAQAHEVPVHEWTAFFEDFTDRYRGKVVTVEARDPDSPEMSVIAEGLPLVGVSVDFQDDDDGTIQVMVGVEPSGHITHTILQPTFVWKYQSESGADEAIELESASGPTTVVRL